MTDHPRRGDDPVSPERSERFDERDERQAAKCSCVRSPQFRSRGDRTAGERGLGRDGGRAVAENAGRCERAGPFGVRALANAAALELRPLGIRVALLIVDAGIQPLDGSIRGAVSPEALADPRRIADAVLFLADQDARAATHELQLTPLAENWTP